MKDKIDQLMELLQDRGYEISPTMFQELFKLTKELDQETKTLADLLDKMQSDYEHLMDCKVVEYASYITMLPKHIVYQDYGMFKLGQQIENQLQNEMN